MILYTHRTTAPRQAVRSPRTGFTLLEVLVVVAIIVMLAGVGGYYFIQQYETSKNSRAKIDALALSSMVEQYYIQNNNQYPQSIDELTQPHPQTGNPPLCGQDKIYDPWGQKFVVDPAGTHNNSLKADVYTTNPKTGLKIGNF